MAAVGTGRAKLLLFGEHAAVYGYPAVGLSLGAAITAELERDGRGDWQLDGVAEEDREAVLRTLRVVEALAGSGPSGSCPGLASGGQLRLRSAIPRGLGFGSSAALCVAVASAFAPQRRDPRRTWAWAHQAERLFHGTPSGVDTGLSLLGGLYSFQPRPPALPDARRLQGIPLNLVVGAVPRRAHAASLIAGLRERIAAGDGATRARLEGLGQGAALATAILAGETAGGLERLGELTLEAAETLAQLGLSSAELDAALAQGREAGALGGKLSGAGGGGAFYLLYPDSGSAREAAQWLRRSAEARGLPTAGTIGALSLSPREGGDEAL